jgi:hypothetical protein
MEEEEIVDLGSDENGPWATMPQSKYELPLPEPSPLLEEGVTLESIPVPIPLMQLKQKNKRLSSTNILPTSSADATAAGTGAEGGETAQRDNVHIVEPDEEAEKWERVNEKKISYTLPPRPERGSTIGEVNTPCSFVPVPSLPLPPLPLPMLVGKINLPWYRGERLSRQVMDLAAIRAASR